MICKCWEQSKGQGGASENKVTDEQGGAASSVREAASTGSSDKSRTKRGRKYRE